MDSQNQSQSQSQSQSQCNSQGFVTSLTTSTTLLKNQSPTKSSFQNNNVCNRKTVNNFSTTITTRRTRPNTIHSTIAAPSSPSPSPSPSPSQSPSPTSDAHSVTSTNVIRIQTPEQFDKVCEQANESNALICIDFMAIWCRKCKYLLPRVNKLSVKYPNVYFCVVDVNAVMRLPKQFNIVKMPTFVFFQNNDVLHTLIGGASPQKAAAQLESLVQKLSQSSP